MSPHQSVLISVTNIINTPIHTVSHEGGDGSGTADEDGTAKSHMPPFYVVNFIIK